MAKYIIKSSGKEVQAWESHQQITPEVQFLLEHKKLKLNHEDPFRFFESEFSTASSFSVLIIQDIIYSDDNKVRDADFYFVSCAELVTNYELCK